jgi:hypothetical protein
MIDWLFATMCRIFCYAGPVVGLFGVALMFTTKKVGLFGVALMFTTKKELSRDELIMCVVFPSACALWLILKLTEIIPMRRQHNLQVQPMPQPKPVPKPVVRTTANTIERDNKHYVGIREITGYHGTPNIDNIKNAIVNGLIPGDGDAYGVGVYITKDRDEALKTYGKGTGYYLKLRIEAWTDYHYYDLIPGASKEAKHAWVMRSDNQLVYIRDKEWFVVFGNKGVPVRIPGLKSVEVYNHNHNRITV